MHLLSTHSSSSIGSLTSCGDEEEMYSECEASSSFFNYQKAKFLHISCFTLNSESNWKIIASKLISRSPVLSKMLSVDELLVSLTLWHSHMCPGGWAETGRTKSVYWFAFSLWVKMTDLLSHTVMNGTKEIGRWGESPPNRLLDSFRRKDCTT